MKRRRTLSLILALTVLMSLVSFAASAQRSGRRQRVTPQTPKADNQRANSKQSATAQQGTDEQNLQNRRRRGRRGATDPIVGGEGDDSVRSGGGNGNVNANQARRGRRGANDASNTSTTQGTNRSVSVARQLNQLRLSAAQIKTIQSLPELRGVVSIHGNTIRPRAGSSLWLLSSRAYYLVGGSTTEPLASEIATSISGQFVWWRACYCPSSDPNKDDGCKFDGEPKDAAHCKQTGGVNCRCTFKEGVIQSDGTPVIETATP